MYFLLFQNIVSYRRMISIRYSRIIKETCILTSLRRDTHREQASAFSLLNCLLSGFSFNERLWYNSNERITRICEILRVKCPSIFTEVNFKSLKLMKKEIHRCKNYHLKLRQHKKTGLCICH